MKAMKTLLCVLLSLMLALGMFGASAEAALDGGVTLRNVALTIGEETFALSQQARILGNLDEDSAALRFEILNGENVLLPVAGEIDAEGVRFTLDDSGRVYSLDMAMIQEVISLDEETLGMLEEFGGLFTSYATAVEALADPANEEILIQWTEKLLTAMIGQPAEVEMDINGASYPGIEFKSALTLNNILSALELIENTGVAEYDAFWKEYLTFMGKTSGMEISSFADLKALMLEDGVAEEDLNMELGTMEMTIGGDDSVACARMTMTMADAEEGVDAVVAVEAIETAEKSDMTMTMDVGEENDRANVTFTCSADLSDAEVSAVDAALNFDFASDYAYDDGYTSYMSSAVVLTVNAEKADGLWDAALDMDFASEEGYGYEGDVSTYASALALDAACTEKLDADGAAVAAVDVKLDFDGETYGLAFELKQEEASGLTALAAENATLYPLTDDMEDAAYTMLSADAMGLMADVMELGADETIIRIGQKFTDMMMSAYEAYDETGYEEYEDYEDYSDYEVEYTTVSTFEEAAAIYPYEIPAFTAPEGYTLSYIEVSEQDVYAEYVTADSYDYIGMYVCDFGMDLTEPGSAEVSYYDNGEGQVVGAEVVDGSTYVSFYFIVDSQEEAEAIMAGLVM